MYLKLSEIYDEGSAMVSSAVFNIRQQVASTRVL